MIDLALETPEDALRLDGAVLLWKKGPHKKINSKINQMCCHIANNIGRVREVAVQAARPGWRGGRSSGRRDKGHLKRKAFRPAAANTLLCVGAQ